MCYRRESSVGNSIKCDGATTLRTVQTFRQMVLRVSLEKKRKEKNYEVCLTLRLWMPKKEEEEDNDYIHSKCFRCKTRKHNQSEGLCSKCSTNEGTNPHQLITGLGSRTTTLS